jgi:alpha-tubulin suppressor-like RCC1 family protein
MESRPLQVGDLAFVNNDPFLIRSITPEGIYISSTEDPDYLSLLVLEDDQHGQTTKWQVDLYQEPHTVTFEVAPVDLYSSLPPELILEIALSLTLEEIQNLCMTSNKFNEIICENEYFWRRKYLQVYQEEPSFDVISWKELYLGYNVYAFGTNEDGQLGLGDIQRRKVPTLIPNIKARQISAGYGHSLLIDLENNVYAFGFNYLSQLGLGDRLDRSVPTLIPDIKAKQVAAGEAHSLLIDLENNVYAFGENDEGQLGLGDIQTRSVPTLIPNIKARQIAAGPTHSLILDLDGNGSDPSSGRVFAFGENQLGQLGLGDTHDRSVPTLIPNIKAQQIAAGYQHSLLIEVKGKVCDPPSGRVYDPTSGRVYDPTSGRVYDPTSIGDRVYDPPSGRVFAFGDNDEGQLGLGDFEDRFVPTLIPNIKAKQVATGFNHSFILDSENNVYAFGSNKQGQLGLGDFEDRIVPTLIPGIKARQIVTGLAHSFIIDLESNLPDPLAGRVSDPTFTGGKVSDPFAGRVYAFGENNKGQLGLGHIENYPTPTLIPGIKAQQVAAGYDHSFILGYKNGFKTN